MDDDELPEWFTGPIRMARVEKAMEMCIEQVRELQAKAGPMDSLAELASRVREDALREAFRRAYTPTLSSEAVFAALANVAAATESLTVTVVDGSGSARSRPLSIVPLAILLLWLIAIVLPLAESDLTPKEQQIINGYIATVALALPIHLLLREYRNRRPLSSDLARQVLGTYRKDGAE